MIRPDGNPYQVRGLFLPAFGSTFRNECVLFIVLGALGTTASYISINIPNTDAFVEGRWIFGFMGFALFKRSGSALVLACLLSVTGFHKLPLHISFLGNMLYAIPALFTIRWVHFRFLSQIRHMALYTAAWFFLVMVCYQAFNTPGVWGFLALLKGLPVLSTVLEGWKDQPFLIESLIVSVVSASGMLAVLGQKAVYQSNVELATTLDSIGDGVIATDARGIVKRINPVAQDLTGWLQSEAMGKPLSEVFNAVNAKTGRPVENPVERVLQEGMIVGMANDTALISRDGRRRLVADSAAPIRNTGGRLIGTVMVFRDVTSQYQASEMLRRSKEQLDLALHAAVMGVWDWEIESGRMEWAGEHAALFGIPVEEFGGTMEDMRRFVHPMDREIGKEIIRLTRERKSELDWTYRIIRPDKTIHWMHSYGKPISDEKGNLKRVIGTTLDITERKEFEEQLRDQEERLRAILEANPDPIVVYDKEGRPQYINPAFTEIFGWPLDSVQGRRIPFVPEDQKEITQKAIQEVFKYGKGGRIKTKRLTREGETVEVITNAALFNGPDGTPAGMVVNLTDITEQRKLEENLRQSQQMESIGNLAGGIAHDFNNILFPIIGLSEILLEDLAQGSPEHENVREILKAGKRGSELVKQILAFSRQTEHRMIPVRIQSIVEEVLQLGRSAIPSNIAIDRKIQGDCGLVIADPIQVHQIAMNLLTNAYHATEQKGGRISIELKETLLKRDDLVGNPLEPRKYVVLSISDSGCGIDPAIRDKIFDPYFTTKAQGKGTGLGLAVVYGIVKDHGGDIRFYSELGVGSTFTVYLPLMERSLETENIQRFESDRTGHERILLVDDEEPIVRVQKQMLERLGYRVTERTSSFDALEAFRANPDAFDLVVTDMTMSGMTGDQLARELISIRPDISIILCTGFSERINQEKAAAIGIHGFLMKPVVRSEMAGMVRKVLDRAKGNTSTLDA